jgi:methionine-S-sulfoxide reductase
MTDAAGASPTTTAIFAAGCFWGVESELRALPGVLDARVGYTGGRTEHPDYRAVCSHTTGHAEAVEVTFDPNVVTFERLVRHFFEIHDPTQLDRQGWDVGDQYRSAIFTVDEEQRRVADQVIRDLEDQKRFKKPIVTQVAPASTFWAAEEYHQRYFEKRGIAPSCHI